jgi:hypothetical protein
VAPTAVLSGQVSVGPGSCVLHGAVLAAEGGPVQVGVGCVIMENAVLRGTVPHPLLIGDRVLAGPHAQLTGAAACDEVFLAAGAGQVTGCSPGCGPGGQFSLPATRVFHTAFTPGMWAALTGSGCSDPGGGSYGPDLPCRPHHSWEDR